jgi:Pyridoxal-phosphate dependent enzyme
MITDRLYCPNCRSTAVSMAEVEAFACAGCGTMLDVRPRACADPADLIDPDRGLPWRYPALSAVGYAADLDDHVLPRTVRSPLLEAELGIEEAWLVDCTGLGTGTFKDLEAAVVIAGAREMGLDRISVHSTGNTALAYRHYARRAGVPCASYLPKQNAAKFGDAQAADDYPVFLVDTGFPEVSAIAKAAAARDGRRHLAPLGWKLEGKATLAWWLWERIGQVDTIVQTIAGGYGPLGYELGFRRLARVAGASRGVLRDRRYLLFQPGDADTLTRAWRAGSTEITEQDLRLPTEPFEATLQSTNPVATLPQLRATLPAGTQLHAVAPDQVLGAMGIIDKILDEASIELDFQRERSAYISLAGLLGHDGLPRSTKLAFVVTGSRAFRSVAPASTWQTLAP